MAYRFTARSVTPGAYVLASGVLGALLSAANVVDGVDRGDGVSGTYPTTATSKAEQLAVDQAEVNSNVAQIVSGQVVLAGTNPGTHVDTGPVRILGIKASA